MASSDPTLPKRPLRSVGGYVQPIYTGNLGPTMYEPYLFVVDADGRLFISHTHGDYWREIQTGDPTHGS